MNNVLVVKRTPTPEISPVLQERTHYPVNWPVLVVCCLVAIISCIWLLFSARNYQETLSLQLSQQHVGSIYSYISPDNPVPLYYLLAHVLAQSGSLTLTGLRLLSLLSFALMLPVAYLVAVRSSDDRRVGVLSAALIGLSPFMVWFGSRGTAYAPLALIVLINAYFFVGILRRQNLAWIGYGLSAIVGLGFHYFFIVALLTQLLFGLVEAKRLTSITKVLLPITVVLAAVVLAAWIHVSSMHSPAWGSLPYTSRPSATNVFIIFAEFLFGFQSVLTITLLMALWPLLVVLALWAVQKYVSPPIAIRYFVTAAFVPVVAFFALGWITKPLFLTSYLIICLPPFMMVVAWYLVEFELPALIWVRNILLALMAGMLLLELAHTDRAISSDYLGALVPVRVLALGVEKVESTSVYQPALTAKSTTYDGHHTPAAGPPLQLPSDSPGVLTQRK